MCSCLLREKEGIEESLETAKQRAEASLMEIERLKAVNTELLRQREVLEEQKEELNRERERNQKELERG